MWLLLKLCSVTKQQDTTIWLQTWPWHVYILKDLKANY